MIALINMEELTIYLYTETGLEIYDRDHISDFLMKNSGMSITYITNAIETTANDIAEMLGVSTEGYVQQENTGGQKSYFIHSVSDKTLVIKIGSRQFVENGVTKQEDINIIFTGKSDCKLIDGEFMKLINDNFVIKELIKKKQIEIIDENGMRRVMKENEKKIKKKQEIQNMKDRELDSIIIKNSKPGSALDAADGMLDDDDTETVDITDDVKNNVRSLDDIDPDSLSEKDLNDIRSGRRT